MHDAIGQSSNLKIENHGPDLSFNAQARLPGGVPSIFALSNTSACTHCLNCSTLCEPFCQLQLPARQHFVCSTHVSGCLTDQEFCIAFRRDFASTTRSLRGGSVAVSNRASMSSKTAIAFLFWPSVPSASPLMTKAMATSSPSGKSLAEVNRASRSSQTAIALLLWPSSFRVAAC
jgi:hypothetical protein